MSIHSTLLGLPSHDDYINMGIQLGEDPSATRLRERIDLEHALSPKFTSHEQALIAKRFTVLNSEEAVEFLFQRLENISNSMEDLARATADLKFKGENPQRMIGDLRLLEEIKTPTTSLDQPKILENAIIKKKLLVKGKKIPPSPPKQASQVSALSAWYLTCQTAALLFSPIVWLCNGFASLWCSLWQFLISYTSTSR